MDPILIFSLVASWAITKAFFEAGIDQAKQEARAAAEAIREDLKRRGTTWAHNLYDRLGAGRTASPATAIWWGWAVSRATRGLYRKLRRKPRAAERIDSDQTGPFGRIWGAARRGAAYAREQTRKQRKAHEKARATPVGVCARCGVVTAKQALKMTLTRHGRQAWMCASCQTEVAAERAADEAARRAAAEAAAAPDVDVVDAEVVDNADPRPIEQPPPIEGTPLPEPLTLATDPQQTPDSEGEPVTELAPYRPRQASLAAAAQPRALAPAGGSARSGGDTFTHGEWTRVVKDIERRVQMLPNLLEAMLASLNHADAGRSQVQGVMRFYEGCGLIVEELQVLLREVNARERPVVEAVAAAGGPDEVPSISYLSSV